MSKESSLTYDVKSLKTRYPIGTKIKLIRMHESLNPLKPGSTGIVMAIDDIGQIHIKWQSGLRKALIPGIDEFSII